MALYFIRWNNTPIDVTGLILAMGTVLILIALEYKRLKSEQSSGIIGPSYWRRFPLAFCIVAVVSIAFMVSSLIF
jgi:multisubunit Na+/H+ antiporter MnhB subunit